MALDQQEATFIPFGIERWSLDGIRIDALVRQPTRLDAVFPCLLLPRGYSQPLRLNGVPVDLFASANAPVDRSDQLITLRDQMLALCDPWNRSATLFVECYFRAVEDCVVDNAQAIAAGTVGLGSLFEPRDWAYSAPCPLPRAHLLAPGGGGSAETEYVVADFAFWTGAGFVALDVAPSRLLPKAARERRQRLADAGIKLVDKVPADDPAAWLSFFATLLAPPLTTFWQGETVPLGLFRSNALDVLDSLVERH